MEEEIIYQCSLILNHMMKSKYDSRFCKIIVLIEVGLHETSQEIVSTVLKNIGFSLFFVKLLFVNCIRG